MTPLFGIYIHWPFCASKCPYCDFNSHVSETIDHEAWKKAYLQEIDFYAALTKDRSVTSVFFGGGTPSLMAPETVSAIIERIRKNWRVSKDVEITLEANPTSVETEKLEAFKQAGVHRVSIGVQSFRDEDLKFLGRQHDSKMAITAIETAKSIFARTSFDLIYARPGQTLSEWEEELQMALGYAGGHLSLYQLTIEKSTPFYMRQKRGDFSIPGEELAADFYELTQDVLSAHGLPAYEVSNHARAGEESLHNLTYWRYGDYAGIGPGAHGRLTLGAKKQATRGHRAPDVWRRKVKEKGQGGHPFELVSPRERFTECLMMGLRLPEGVPVSKLEEEGGASFEKLLDQKRLERLKAEGLMDWDKERLRAQPKGLACLNGVLSYLL